MEGKQILVEVDTGAGVSIIILPTWRSHFSILPLECSEILRPRSEWCYCEVWWPNKKLAVPVVDGDGPSLLSKDWLKQLCLNWTQTFKVKNSSQMEDLMQKCGEIFRDELRTACDFKTSLKLKELPQPKLLRQHPQPLAIQDPIGHEFSHESQNTMRRSLTLSGLLQ